METLMRLPMDPYMMRFVEKWLRTRRFSMRLRGPAGQHFSPYKPVTRGLPQGGVLSPFLWLLHFNSLHDDVRREVASWEEPMAGVRVMDCYFADDITIVLAHANSEVLVDAAVRIADFLEERLAKLGLILARPKCCNLVVSPGRMIGQVFRRKSGFTRSYQKDLPKNDRLKDQRACLAEQMGDTPSDAFPLALREALPYAYTDPLKILGVWWDARLCFAEHIHRVLDRAKVRHGVMARLARSTWGLEVGVLRSTHAALLVSLSGYGLVAVGSGAYERGLHSLEVQLANISARRIVGVGRSARLATLHMTAGVLSAENQYLRACALLLDRVLRAYNSAIQTRLSNWLATEIGIAGWCSRSTPLDRNEDMIPFTGYMGEEVVKIPEEWSAHLLEEVPVIPYRFLIESTYHTPVELEREDLQTGYRSYGYMGVEEWYDIGLQLLLASGWRPDCVLLEGCSVTRMEPLRTEQENILIFGSPHAVRWLRPTSIELLESKFETAQKALNVEACSFYEERVGYVCAVSNEPEIGLGLKGWLVGSDPSETMPLFMEEASALMALRMVLTVITERPLSKGYIHVRAGTPLLCRHILEWQNTGTVKLRSPAAGEILTLCHSVSRLLMCPLLFEPLTEIWEYEQAVPVRLERLATVVAAGSVRLGEYIRSEQSASWRSRLCRIPLTSEEVKERVKQRYEKDEAAMLPMLCARGSVSGSIYMSMGLTRAVIREAMERLRHSRPLQVTLGSIVCATRFKFFQGSRLLPTECAYCGQIDSLDHLISCVNIGVLPKNSDMLVSYLVELVDRAYNVNPGYPRPIRDGEAAELELRFSDGAESAGSQEEGWLEMEDDTEVPFNVSGLLDGLQQGDSSGSDMILGD